MKKIVTNVLVILVLVSCVSRYADISEREIERNKIIGEFSKQMKKNGLHCCGFGGGEREGKSKYIDVSFQIDCELNIESGRRLIVGTVMAFLDLINSKASFREHLYNYPFTAKNVKISIFANDGEDDGGLVVVDVASCDGDVCYFANNPDPNRLGFITLHEETFEEAVEILKNQRDGEKK